MTKATRLAALALGATVLVWTGVAAGQEGHMNMKGMAQKPGEQKPGTAATHTHEKCTLHGGQVSMTKFHHFETVFAPDGIRVYIYTEQQSPMVADGVKGNVTMTFKDGKKKGVPLDVEAPAEGEKTVYFCPMHSDVVQMEPGVCPKCGGMKLFTQDRLYAKVDLSKVEPGTLEAAFNITDLGDPEPQVRFFERNGKPAGTPEPPKPRGTSRSRPGKTAGQGEIADSATPKTGE